MFMWHTHVEMIVSTHQTSNEFDDAIRLVFSHGVYSSRLTISWPFAGKRRSGRLLVLVAATSGEAETSKPMTNVAMENGHRNSGISHSGHGDVLVRCVSHYQRVA